MQTSGRFLLDTNIIIALFAGESSINEHLQQAEETFLPSIALGNFTLVLGSQAGLIAAIARQYRLTLVTRDTHFGEIEELMVERW